MAKKRVVIQRACIVLLSFMTGLLIVTTLAILPDALIQLPASAQRVRPEAVWQAVYERVPSLPKENQYVSKDTGKVDPGNTLVSRFVRYHLYVAGRSPLYRFDWKLTVADYLGLGLNGAFDETSYPSRATLRTNPAEGDRAAINRLNRAQREALVQVLVDAFSTAADASQVPTSAPRLLSSPAANP